MTDDIAMMSATGLRRHYRTKRISPVETAGAVLDRIVARDGALNAFRFVAAQEALAAARASETRRAKRCLRASRADESVHPFKRPA
jgi:aspartyl-tRNA(Asn)/glutamyl-tRNA(Gln) amidotransferase subunit A